MNRRGRGGRVVRRMNAGYVPRESKLPKRSSVNVRFRLTGAQIRNLVVIIGALLIANWVWGIFAIRSVNVAGNTHIPKSEILTIVNNKIGKGLSRNLLLINGSTLSQALSTSDYRIQSASIKRNWTHGLTVTVSEREIALNWRAGDQTFLLDSDGTIVALSSGSYLKLPTVVDSTNLPVKVGDKVVPPRFVKFCTDLIDQLPRKAKLTIAEISVPDTTSEVYVKTDKGYIIKFDTTREASGEVGDLLAVLKQIGKPPSEYVDLRIEHKAYYR